MATFVLLHGMWHGGWCWRYLTPRLREAGHDVYTPALTGLGERLHLNHDDIDLNTHIRDIVNLIEFEELRDVILVGHSFGGTLAPAIAEQVPDRVARLVNIDGPLPVHGLCLKDLIGDTWDFFLAHAVDPGDAGRIQPIADWTFGVSGADLDWLRARLTPPAAQDVDNAPNTRQSAGPGHSAAVHFLYRGTVTDPKRNGRASGGPAGSAPVISHFRSPVTGR